MAVLQLFLAAVTLGSCTGAVGGSGAEEGEGTIALSLASVTSSRSARAAGEWSTATGTFAVSIESDGYYYSDSKTIQLSPGSPRSITFKSVPVGVTVTVSATFTGTFDGIPESKTYTGSVTKTIHSGHNVIALSLTESGGDEQITISFSGGTYSVNGCNIRASSLDNISPSAAVAIVVSCEATNGEFTNKKSYTWSQFESSGFDMSEMESFRKSGATGPGSFIEFGGTDHNFDTIITIRVKSVTVDGVAAVIAGDPEFHRSE